MAGKKASKAKTAGKSNKGSGKRYTDAERKTILETASRENLTGAQVRKRFGVSTLSFYQWRKKAGTSGGRARVGRPAKSGPGRAGSSDFGGQIAAEIRQRVQDLIPGIVEEEIRRALGASATGGRRR